MMPENEVTTDNVAADVVAGHNDGEGFVGSGAEVADSYEGPTASVFILTSPTYVRENEDAPFDDVIVGVFATRLAAETYKADATPPVTDGKIVQWGVEGVDGSAPVGRIAPFHSRQS
jgi:hypothetical protein